MPYPLFFNLNFNLTSSFLSIPHTLPRHPFQHNILHDDMHSSVLHETTVFSFLPPLSDIFRHPLTADLSDRSICVF